MPQMPKCASPQVPQVPQVTKRPSTKVKYNISSVALVSSFLKYLHV